MKLKEGHTANASGVYFGCWGPEEECPATWNDFSRLFYEHCVFGFHVACVNVEAQV